MRFLADENLPGPVVRALRDLGHDVSWAREDAVGAADWLLLARAQAEQRIIVTCDTDFGELAFHSGFPAASGVILLRITWTGLEADNRTADLPGITPATPFESPPPFVLRYQGRSPVRLHPPSSPPPRWRTGRAADGQALVPLLAGPRGHAIVVRRDA